MTITDRAAQYVQQYLIDNLPTTYLYHNFNHAEEVAETCEKLAKDADLSSKEQEIVVLAAWFHDCGYAKYPDQVEEGSVEVASDFLTAQDYSSKKIEQVVGLIQSIHGTTAPESDLEKIIHDANYSFIGRKRFFRRAKLLRLEEEKLTSKTISAINWNQQLLDLLTKHSFKTIWAQERFSRKHHENVITQRKNIQKSKEKTRRRKTGKNFGRGVDTLYRVTLRNHIDMSNIADGKANMIISINTLVLSILITASAAGISLDRVSFERNLSDVVPILLLMLTSLTTIIFAVLSALPKVSGISFTEEDIKQHKVSLLFFGNFLQINKSKFVDHLRELKKDQELLYDDLSRDLYNLGNVLDKKYYLLNISYRVFIGGLVVSFLAFLISYFA